MYKYNLYGRRTSPARAKQRTISLYKVHLPWVKTTLWWAETQLLPYWTKLIALLFLPLIVCNCFAGKSTQRCKVRAVCTRVLTSSMSTSTNWVKVFVALRDQHGHGICQHDMDTKSFSTIMWGKRCPHVMTAKDGDLIRRDLQSKGSVWFEASFDSFVRDNAFGIQCTTDSCIYRAVCGRWHADF